MLPRFCKEAASRSTATAQPPPVRTSLCAAALATALATRTISSRRIPSRHSETPVPLSLWQQQHRLYRDARGGVGSSAVDLGKIVTRDEPVERHPARHEKIDEARDEVPRSTVTLDHAAHNPAALQPRHLEADLRAGAS